MSKEIKDYLHLYLGCDCEVERIKYPTRKNIEALLPNHLMLTGRMYKLKPILRPLSDMTEEERKKCNVPKHWHQDDLHELIDEEAWSFEQVRYMLSKHFDIFGLIEAGLAIDKTKMQTL